MLGLGAFWPISTDGVQPFQIVSCIPPPWLSSHLACSLQTVVSSGILRPSAVIPTVDVFFDLRTWVLLVLPAWALQPKELEDWWSGGNFGLRTKGSTVR